MGCFRKWGALPSDSGQREIQMRGRQRQLPWHKKAYICDLLDLVNSYSINKVLCVTIFLKLHRPN